MNLPSIIALVEIIITLTIAFLTLITKNRTQLHNLFILMLFCLIIWLLGGMIGYSVETKEKAIFWFKFASPGFLFLHACTLHFCLVYTGSLPNRRLFLPLLYLPSVIFFLFSMNRLIVFSDFFRAGNIWLGAPAYGDPLFYLIILHYTVYYILCFIVLLRFRRRTISRMKQTQSLIIFLSILITEILFNLEPFVLPLITGKHSFLCSQLFSIIWVAGIWIAIFFYGLMDLFPAKTYMEMLYQISSPVILFDQEDRISLINDNARTDFNITEGNLKNLKITDLFRDSETVLDQIKYFKNNGENNTTLDIIKGNKQFRCGFTKLFNRFGEYSGVLLVAREKQEMENIRNCFNLTKRESEIVFYLLHGRTNKEISQELGIAPRTVKAHITSIYNKCNVRNRLELIRMIEMQ